MTGAQSDALSLDVYRSPEVVSHYAALAYITPCEQFLFDRYIRSNAAILDMGVGGGRTTPCLSQRASRYVGLDYSEEMVSVCRQKFPGLEFMQRNAADLSCFPDASFDAAVMAFNGLDYLSSAARARCLQETYRVLKSGGVFVFSSHNPRAILVWPEWNRERVTQLAMRFAGTRKSLLSIMTVMLSIFAATWAFLRAAWASLVRTVRRLSQAAFWRGEGYLLDSAHGGLVTHCALPGRVRTELAAAGFHFRERQSNHFPRSSHSLATDWYYYVFARFDATTSGAACES